MTRVDLDAVEVRLGTRYGEVVTFKADEVMAMAAELRAAREVVEAARWIERTGALPPSNEVGARRLSDLEQAVRAYDQAVQP